MKSKISGEQRLKQLISEVKEMYQQLKSCEYEAIQQTIIWSLKPKCNELSRLFEAENKSQNVVKKRQVEQIMKKIIQVEKRISDHDKVTSNVGLGGRNKDYGKEIYSFDFNKQINVQSQALEVDFPHNQRLSRQQIQRTSQEYLRRLTIDQMDQANLKYTKEELEQVLMRFHQNNELMKHIQEIVIGQNQALDRVENNIETAQKNVIQANILLRQAEKQQLKAIRLAKMIIHKSVVGFWGIVAWPFKKAWGLSWKLGKQKNNVK